MKRLTDIGFRNVGRWVRTPSDRLMYELQPEYTDCCNVLYAFICDGVVLYVGKTVGTLKHRMRGYQTPGRTQSTNTANRSISMLCQTMGFSISEPSISTLLPVWRIAF